MSLFSNVVTTDKVIIKPNQYVSKNLNDLVLKKLKQKVEGICTYHGYIKPGSCSIVSKSEGRVLDMTFNGNISYNVVFKAQLCNPDVDSIISCKVVNTNNFGTLAISYIEIDNMEVPIIEAIIVKKETDKAVNIGDIISVQIKGKKFDLHDKKITVHGIIIDEIEEKYQISNSGGSISNNNENLGEDDEELYSVNEDVESEEEDEDEDEDEEDEEEVAVGGADVYDGGESDGVESVGGVESDGDDGDIGASEAGGDSDPED